MRKNHGFIISWKGKSPGWAGVLVLFFITLSVSGQDITAGPEPIPVRNELSEIQISVLITKKNWEKVSECGFSAVVPLVKALKDNDVEMRAGAAEVLGAIGDKRAVEPLIEILGDKDRQVRQQAAKALGKIGSNRAVESLAACLKDPSREVRLEAVEALKNIADSWSFKSLLKSLNDTDASVRKEAVKAILVTGGRRAVDPFLEYLKNPESKSKVEVIRALGVLGDKRAVEPLISLLRDKDPSVRAWTVEVLRKIGDEKIAEPLRKIADDPDPEVRNKVAETLKKFQVAVKPPVADKPVEAAVRKPEEKTESPAPTSKVPVQGNVQPDTKPDAVPAVIKTRPVEKGKEKSSSWIYGIIGGAVVVLSLIAIAGSLFGMKRREDVIMELDNLLSQIREICRNGTNDSTKDAALNLLRAHAEAFVQFSLDEGSREKKMEHLASLDDSTAKISEILGAGHHGIRHLLKMRKLVKTAIDKGFFDNPASSVKKSIAGGTEKKGNIGLSSSTDAVEEEQVPLQEKEAPVPQKGKSTCKCAKCRRSVLPAGPAEDEPAEHSLIEQSKPPPGILALKKQEGKGTKLLLEYLKKHNFCMFCRDCSAVRCHQCLKTENPSKCEKCGGDMVIYR